MRLNINRAIWLIAVIILFHTTAYGAQFGVRVGDFEFKYSDVYNYNHSVIQGIDYISGNISDSFLRLRTGIDQYNSTDYTGQTHYKLSRTGIKFALQYVFNKDQIRPYIGLGPGLWLIEEQSRFGPYNSVKQWYGLGIIAHGGCEAQIGDRFVIFVEYEKDFIQSMGFDFSGRAIFMGVRMIK